MPTQYELLALYDAGIRDGDSKGNHIIDIYRWVWASEPQETHGSMPLTSVASLVLLGFDLSGSSNAAMVSFVNRNLFWIHPSLTTAYRALPVRDGN